MGDEREGGGRWGRERERESGLLLAVSVLQIKMRVEVDEDLLAGLRGCDHPHALLGGRVGAGIARGGQVVRGVDLYIPSAFICRRKKTGEKVGESVEGN